MNSKTIEVYQHYKSLYGSTLLLFRVLNNYEAYFDENFTIKPDHVVAVLRSRGHYSGNNNITNNTCGTNENSNFDWDVNDIILEASSNGGYTYVNCEATYESDDDEKENSFTVSSSNYGKFVIVGKKGDSVVCKYSVSLDPTSKDYIVNVLGTTPSNGTTAVYVEELYDLNYAKLLQSGEDVTLNKTLIKYTTPEYSFVKDDADGNEIKNVADLLTVDYTALKRSNLGQLFLAKDDSIKIDTNNKSKHNSIYKVTKDGEGYVYTNIGNLAKDNEVVFVVSYNSYFDKDGAIASDFSNYKEQYRSAVTPWFVSELKGDVKNIDVKKLFRFHTISDGNSSNTEIKISIANIKPEDGTFDVLVRNFNDTDASVNILERFNRCTMMPGSVNYIGMKIGTIDGAYELKSKYVMLEVVEDDTVASCVPCGFLGYPVRNYKNGNDTGVNYEVINNPDVTYNTIFNDEIKDKRQYFGISNITGFDVDVLKYKGFDAYNHGNVGNTCGFHLDSTINKLNETVIVTVDGILGYTWDTVSPNSVTGTAKKAPVIGSENEMKDTIYENVNNRKFTACFYGGFDGWDEFRAYRTNGNEYKATKYKGEVNSYNSEFSSIGEGDGLKLPANAITSDYYAYLAGIKQFENPAEIDINIFATPGIDYVNNKLLVDEVIDMIEEDRDGDALYIVTTPDKALGNSDVIDEMYSADEAVNNLEDADIDSSYAATYYPWVKFYDSVNSVYINLPVTKDVVRNMAAIDNKSYPWFTPAGMDRGSVNCEKAHKFIKLEEEDTLYEGGINPIKSFSQDGVKVWGNKTLYLQESPLNRINVRRLMIYMRKLIMLASNKLIFEQNDNTLKAQFEGIVNPILADIKSNRGITDYRLEVSQTPEEMDAHELNVKIWVKPTGSLEYIDISFMVTPQSVNFNE